MGSLSSTPKVPARQQKVVYVPAPTQSNVTTKVVASAKTDDVSKAREKTLLARKRGRMGTIATSLQGLLSEVKPDKRKTLLGE